METYQVAERFKSIQGEGVYAGTPMAFIRFAGCSVGKKICNACDTDFEKLHNFRGGGVYDEADLLRWAHDRYRICFTGGEPLDQDLYSLLKRNEYMEAFNGADHFFHVETSGTMLFQNAVLDRFRSKLWICVSPKPGFKEETIAHANEIKVIVPGLGSGEGWPSLQDALRWADGQHQRPVFLQPRNLKHEVDKENLQLCQELVQQNPTLRLSVQMHKVLKVR